MFIDTHCHIHDRETYDFAISRQQKKSEEDFSPRQILKRARNNNVRKMIVVGTSEKDSLLARDFASAEKDVYWSWGVHPDEAEEYGLSEPVDNPVAIGEVGLDYHNGTDCREAQIKMLRMMIGFAKTRDLPLIFHVRDAFDDFWPIVDELGVERAVIHSFSDSEENLKKALDRGFYIGVNGLATFTDLPTPPLSRTLLETDAPFLAPVPVRGRVNEPSYVPFIAEFLAEKHGVDVKEIARITTENAQDLFGI